MVTAERERFTPLNTQSNRNFSPRTVNREA